MTAKIEDVARQAGVSTATVSRVLSGKPYVSAELRGRVLGAVQDLNYRPSRVARSLRVQRSSIIGLIISDIQNPFFTSVVRAVEDVAYSREHSVFLCNSDEDAAKETMYIELMLAEHVAGIIVSATAADNPVYRRLVEARVPVVAIDRRVTAAEMDTVVLDNVAAAYQVVSHLVEQGHRRIGAVLGTPGSSTGEERRVGYLRAMQAHKLPIDPGLVRIVMPRVVVGYEATRDLLELAEPPTAIFTGNNLLTIGALQAIHELGLRIPEQVALAAFDEVEWTVFLKPALTVVAQPTYEMGRTAAELLLRRIATPDSLPQEVTLSHQLIVRDSSRSMTRSARRSDAERRAVTQTTQT